jgi:hypothetical protein
VKDKSKNAMNYCIENMQLREDDVDFVYSDQGNSLPPFIRICRISHNYGVFATRRLPYAVRSTSGAGIFEMHRIWMGIASISLW